MCLLHGRFVISFLRSSCYTEIQEIERKREVNP